MFSVWWYPKNTPVGIVPGKHFTWFTVPSAVPFMFPSINCEFIEFESLKQWRSDFTSFQVNWNIFVWNCFKYILERCFQFKWNWIQRKRFFFLPNKIELTASIEFGNKSNSLKRSSWIMFDYWTNRTKIRPIGFDWVRLIFGSVSFD